MMLSSLLKSELRAARVTEVAPGEGDGVSIDHDLMDAVKIAPFERVLVANAANGKRCETHASPAARGSGTVSLRGAASHLGVEGDRVTISAFCFSSADGAVGHRPLVLALDERNRPVGGLREM